MNTALFTMSASDWVRRLGLLPHPEGGHYLETYRSGDEFDVAPTKRRSASNAIYFLLEAGQFSALHRIASDEVWHFYDGGSLEVTGILPDGSQKGWRIGRDFEAGDRPQCVVPARAWFGARLVHPHPFALVSCTVAPGFDFADLELADRAGLTMEYPKHSGLIRSLTHP